MIGKHIRTSSRFFSRIECARRGRTILCATLALLAVPRVGVRAEEQVTPEANALERMSQAEGRILSALQVIADHASDLAALARQLNQLTSTNSKDTGKSEQLYAKLWADF